MRLKQTITIIIFGCIFLGILLAIGHLLTIFLDGELLAWQVVPPLPDNRIEVSDGCLSGSSAKCRAITYITPESPESVFRSWSGKNVMINSHNGTIYYGYDACNYSFFGSNYAVLHAYPDDSLGFSCAFVSVYYDQDKEATLIRVDLGWTDCLRIPKIFVPYRRWLFFVPDKLYSQCYN